MGTHSSSSTPFSFSTLENARDIRRALDFRLEVYRSTWPDVPSSAVVDSLDPRAQHFIATNSAGDIVGAFRFVPPDARPFDIESYIDLRDVLPIDSTPAEVGRLCIRPTHRNSTAGVRICMGLLEQALLKASEFAVTDFVMKCASRLISFYRVAGFQPVGHSFIHPSYGEEHILRRHLTAGHPGPSGRAGSIPA